MPVRLIGVEAAGAGGMVEEVAMAVATEDHLEGPDLAQDPGQEVAPVVEIVIGLEVVPGRKVPGAEVVAIQDQDPVLQQHSADIIKIVKSSLDLLR